MKQRLVFLESEGDAWFERNTATLGTRRFPSDDPVLVEILGLPQRREGMKILEIGCGEAGRLAWIKQNLPNWECHGIEPSAHAGEIAKARGVAVVRGTADSLPFDDGVFDVLIFGFCLYLCDREDLFRIAYEADRVLANPGWLLIHDFYSPTAVKREYKHRTGLFTYKMDYRNLFTWHPACTCFRHTVRHHTTGSYTDEVDEWVAVSVLRKNLPS